MSELRTNRRLFALIALIGMLCHVALTAWHTPRGPNTAVAAVTVAAQSTASDARSALAFAEQIGAVICHTEGPAQDAPAHPAKSSLLKTCPVCTSLHGHLAVLAEADHAQVVEWPGETPVAAYVIGTVLNVDVSNRSARGPPATA